MDLEFEAPTRILKTVKVRDAASECKQRILNLNILTINNNILLQ